MLISRLLFFSALITLATPGRSQSLDTFLSPTASIWQRPLAEIANDLFEAGFRPVSRNVGADLRSVKPGISILGMPIHEATLSVADDHLASISLSIYNRGDAASLGEDAFRELVNSSLDKLGKHFGSAADNKRRQRRGSYMKVYLAEWHDESVTAALLWSDTDEHRQNGIDQPYRAEYLTLKMVPPGDAATSVSSGADTARQRDLGDLKDHLKKNGEGDVWIDGIPMVDQEQKGYCAVAAAERLFRYYGLDIDQHELAQVAESSADRGTSSEIMVDALKRSGAKLGVRIRTHESLDNSSFERLVRDYNSTARRAKKEKLELDSRQIDVAAVYRSMDPEVLLDTKTKRPTDMNRFATLAERYIDRGIPLVWTTIVGIYPETPPVTGFGGHLRLIIGYNRKSNEIIYTDTWGPGHELKRMPLNIAWTITTGAYTFEPRLAH